MIHNIYKIVVVVLRLAALWLIASPLVSTLALFVAGIGLNKGVFLPLGTNIVLGVVLWFFAKGIGALVVSGLGEG